jgi:hypothetical protein
VKAEIEREALEEAAERTQQHHRDELRDLNFTMKSKPTAMKLQMKNLHNNSKIKMGMM